MHFPKDFHPVARHRRGTTGGTHAENRIPDFCAQRADLFVHPAGSRGRGIRIHTAILLFFFNGGEAGKSEYAKYAHGHTGATSKGCSRRFRARPAAWAGRFSRRPFGKSGRFSIASGAGRLPDASTGSRPLRGIRPPAEHTQRAGPPRPVQRSFRSGLPVLAPAQLRLASRAGAEFRGRIATGRGDSVAP